MKITKKRKEVLALVDSQKQYTLQEASELLKKITYTKFDASVDLDIRLGVNPKKDTEMVRGICSLPHGTGKVIRVLALCTPEKEQEAKEAGADYVGLDEYVDKIKSGWLEFDVIVTMPQVMVKVGQLGKILGPRGLMPSPKSGTVTAEVGKTIKELKAGQIDFRTDKNGIVHASVGRVSFSPEQIQDNAKEFIRAILAAKPQALKGTYVKSIYVSSTMSPGICIDLQQLNEING